MLTGCSLLKRESADTANSGNAMPLYPVNTTAKVDYSLNGHWYVDSVGGMKLRGIEYEDWPYLEFVDTEGRFYGTNGCNIVNGSFKVGPKQTLALTNVATTMRLCAEDSLSSPIDRAINTVTAFSIASKADGTRLLRLYNKSNLPVMTLRKSDIDFLNGAWQVTGINGKEVKVENARLIIDVNEGSITGNAGCNRLMGVLNRNPQVSNSVQFSHLATTRMTCPDIETESSLLIALEEVTSAKAGKGNTVNLNGPSGKTLVTLKRLSREDLRETL